MKQPNSYSPEMQPAIRLIQYKFKEVEFHVKSDSSNSNDFGEIKVSLIFTPKIMSDSDGNIIEIEFQINISNESNTLLLNCIASTMFETNGIIIEDITNHPLIVNNAPAIVFPYLRAFISNLTLQAGYSPLNLPAYNFTQLKNTN